MKNILSFLLLSLITVFLFTSCKKKSDIQEYYIISKDDYTDFANKHSKNEAYIKKPVERCFIEGSLYTQLVIVFDSSDIVYLYQTETFKNKPMSDVIDREETKYQNFIGLKPEHFLQFNSKNFIDFIDNNKDMLRLDSSSHSISIFYIASNKDTIINPAYYNLVNYITANKKKQNICYNVRLTTEEENNVIYCKRKHLTYDPLNFKWSKHSIISYCKPFTREFDSIENLMYNNIVRARMTYIIDTLKISGKIL